MSLGNDWPRRLDNDWQDRGECKNHPELTWYPGHGEPQHEQVAICRTCPVQSECLAYALSLPVKDDWGIWGGLSEQKRSQIRRRRNPGPRPVECGTRSGYERHRTKHEPICDDCREAKNLDQRRRRTKSAS